MAKKTCYKGLYFCIYTCCTIMVIYQFSLSLKAWLWEQPTTMTMATRPITIEEFPSIQLCTKPGLDLAKIRDSKIGYFTETSFASGYFNYSDCISSASNGNLGDCQRAGWNGKYGNISVDDMLVVNYEKFKQIASPTIRITLKNDEGATDIIDAKIDDLKPTMKLFPITCFHLNIEVFIC